MSNVSQPSHLDFAFAEIERRVDLGLQQMDALDTKAGLVLASGSFVLAGIAVLQTDVAGHPKERVILNVLTLGAVLIYLAVVGCAWRAYRLQDYEIPPKPDRMKQYLEQEQQGTLTLEPKVVVMNALLDAFAWNQTIIESKTTWTDRALTAFLLEALLVAVLLGAVVFL